MPIFQKQSLGKFKPATMLLELIVIVIGISASFWVDEWREKKQDTETFNRIIGEVYYGLALDDYPLAFDATRNNKAAVYAGNLAIKQRPLPDVAELFEQINVIFEVYPSHTADGAYERLVNSSLAIPINQTQVALDRGYSAVRRLEQQNHLLFGELQELAKEHWFSQGVAPCRELDKWLPPQPGLDLIGMLAPMKFAVRNEEGECLTDASNHEISLRLMESESFRSVLLRALNIRQQLAVNHNFARQQVYSTRESMLIDQPLLTMPIQSIQLQMFPKGGGFDDRKIFQLQRVAPLEWKGTVSLVEGSALFGANDSNTIRWARRPSWLRKGVDEHFDIEANNQSWFPSNRAAFRGYGIVVESGNYDVYFNSQTYEYRFEEVE